MQHQHETMNGKIYKLFYDVGAYLSPDAYKCENVKNWGGNSAWKFSMHGEKYVFFISMPIKKYAFFISMPSEK